MTREQFENLKIGDKVRHSFGGIGIVTAKDGGTYTLKDKGFDGGDGCDEVSFAWNEGEPVRKENIRNYVEVYEALRKAVPPTASMLAVMRAAEFLLADCIAQSGASDELKEQTYKAIPNDIRDFVKAFELC